MKESGSFIEVLIQSDILARIVQKVEENCTEKCASQGT